MATTPVPGASGGQADALLGPGAAGAGEQSSDTARLAGRAGLERPGAAGTEASGAADGSALLPAPHFWFNSFQVITGVQPVGSPNAVPGTAVAVYQTAVAQQAIQPNQTPNAAPRTPLAAYQTAVALRAIQPHETPNAVPWVAPIATTGLLATPFVPPPLLPGLQP